MAKAVRAGRRLDRLPLVDEETGDLTVVVETPKASRNKYKYDAERDVMRLYFAGDLSQREIARRMGMSQMKVCRVLRRGVERLRDADQAAAA